jgi:hypothetical protein
LRGLRFHKNHQPERQGKPDVVASIVVSSASKQSSEFFRILRRANFGTLMPFIGSRSNQLPLELGQSAQHGEHQSSVGRRRVSPGIRKAI